MACLATLHGCCLGFIIPPATTSRARQGRFAVAMSSDDAGGALDRRSWGARVGLGLGLGLVAGMGQARAAEEVPVVRSSLGGVLEPYSDIGKVRRQHLTIVIMPRMRKGLVVTTRLASVRTGGACC
jgi:hypothetical protein